MKKWFGSVSLLVLLSGSARSHDFWIRPSGFRPAPGSRVEIDLRVGEGFRGESVARNPERIERFVSLASPGSPEAIAGVDGKAPAGFLRAREGGGIVWIGYQSRPTPIELEAGKFDRYLAEEGLERIVELRRARGESLKPGRERYARCAKSLLRTGPGQGAGIGTKLGFPLEIVPEDDPAATGGGSLGFQLLYRDRPVEGILVGCTSEDAPEKEVRRRTDGEGRVRFELAAKGVWLVRAVHMVPAQAEGADWESYWASLTFEQ
jgi:Domain of unknown function (DUF4198)